MSFKTTSYISTKWMSKLSCEEAIRKRCMSLRMSLQRLCQPVACTEITSKASKYDILCTNYKALFDETLFNFVC